MDLSDRKTQIFAGVLLCLALVINSVFVSMRQSLFSLFKRIGTTPPITRHIEPVALSRPQYNSEPAPRTGPAVDPLEAHGRFVVTYVAPHQNHTLPIIGIAAMDSENRESQELAGAITSHLQASGYELATDVFKPEFVKDGLLNRGFTDDDGLIRDLDLSQSIIGFVVAREQVTYSENPQLENVTTATLHLDIRMRSTDSKRKSRAWTLTSSGAGFNREAAFTMAQERLMKALQSATNITLNSVF